MSESPRTKEGYGHFGILSKMYDGARKGFPDESIDYIFEKIGKEKPSILDIACGTGIATEQLYKRGAMVVGTDIDIAMIEQAEVHNKEGIKYLAAPAEKQPFEDGSFDAVTAFSAFHWFANKEALDEIKRVLKPRGMFFAVNKNEVGDFKKNNKEILKKFIDKEMPDAKKSYNPQRTLVENGFQSVSEIIFSVSEYFSPEEAVEYIQTMSIWNLVREGERTSALKVLRDHFKRIADMEDGRVERKLEVVVVSGESM